MSAVRYTKVYCDFKPCRSFFSGPGHGYQVRMAASKAGWDVGAKADWCPEHRTKTQRAAGRG